MEENCESHKEKVNLNTGSSRREVITKEVGDEAQVVAGFLLSFLPTFPSQVFVHAIQGIGHNPSSETHLSCHLFILRTQGALVSKAAARTIQM